MDEIDSFCGSEFNDGTLEVVKIIGRNNRHGKIYECLCSICAQDPELNGSARYPVTKHRLTSGTIPCACSRRPNWTPDQYRILLDRKGRGRYRVIGSIDDITSSSYVDCSCVVCNYEWNAKVGTLLKSGSGCARCAGNAPVTLDSAITRIDCVCESRDYKFVGFVSGWNNVTSKLNIQCCRCDTQWSPTFNDFVNSNRLGCPSCAVSGYSPSKPGFLYVHLWTGNDVAFLKYGITNNPKRRIVQQRGKTELTPLQLIMVKFDDGRIPANIERAIDQYKKDHSIGPAVSQHIFPDGWTETMAPDSLPIIESIINSCPKFHMP